MQTFYKNQLTGIVLAGGRSARMQSDKAVLDFGYGPAVLHLLRQLEPHCSRLLVVSSRHHCDSFPLATVVPDFVSDCGPLMGIASGLSATDTELNFVIGCDIPDVNINAFHLLCAAMEDADAAVLSVRENTVEPLYAVYRKSLYAKAMTLLESGMRRADSLLSVCKYKIVECTDTGWYANVNTPEDLAKYRLQRGVCR